MLARRIVLMILTIVLAGCAEDNGPNDGVLLILTSTSGTTPDLDGYRPPVLTVDGADSVLLLPSGSVAIGVQPGQHALRLVGVATGCAVASDSVLQVTVTADDTVSVEFDVRCPAPNPASGDGTLLISTATSGNSTDSDGYQLAVDGAYNVLLQPTGRVAIAVQPGRHALRLLDLAPQCLNGPDTMVDVAPGDTVPVAFDIRCWATGVSITVSTTGVDLDTDGYDVLVDRGERAQVQPFDTSLTLLERGSHTIALAGLAANCTAHPASQTVAVADSQVTAVAFAVSCTEASGVIGILIQQSGPPVYASFTLLLDGKPLAADPERFPGEVITLLPGERHYLTNVAAGDHRVSLAPCDLCSFDTEPQSVTVSATRSDTVNLTFLVTCPVPPAEIATLRISAPTTGSPPPSTQYTVRYSVAGKWDYDIGEVALLSSIQPHDAPLSSIEPNGTRFIQVPASGFAWLYWYTFRLDGVPSSCKAHVPSGQGLGFVLTAGDTLDLTFQVTCPP